MSPHTKMLQKTTPTHQLTLFAAAIPVLSGAGPGATDKAKAPTCPDTSLPWSEDCGPGGWSAKMFLHQMLQISQPHWKCSDTESLLSEQMPVHLQVREESEISLSDVIKKPGQASPESYTTPATIRGIIRRALARGRSFRVLLRTEHDTIPVTVTFSTEDSESWTVKSGRPLPGSLKEDFLNFLRV